MKTMMYELPKVNSEELMYLSDAVKYSVDESMAEQPLLAGFYRRLQAVIAVSKTPIEFIKTTSYNKHGKTVVSRHGSVVGNIYQTTQLNRVRYRFVPATKDGKPMESTNLEMLKQRITDHILKVESLL